MTEEYAVKVTSPEDVIKLETLRYFYDLRMHLAKALSGVKRSTNLLYFKGKAIALLETLFGLIAIHKEETLLALYNKCYKIADGLRDIEDAKELLRKLSLLLRTLGIYKVERIESSALKTAKEYA